MITFALIIATFAIAYGLGSIPFGLLLTRMAGLGDVRKIGSGNIGATNVMRTGHKALGIATLVLDMAKGWAAVCMVQTVYHHDFIFIAALFAVLGHIFPVWLSFKGGKGVATALGVLVALNWLAALCFCLVWLTIFITWRVSSLASLASIWSTPIIAFAVSSFDLAMLCLNLAVLLTFTHRVNIERLLHGTEPSFRKG